MSDQFRYDQSEYREQVAQIAKQVVQTDNAVATMAPRLDFELNSYHGKAIRQAEQEQQSKQYPRLHR
ncbi:hypothetical protein D3273_26760 [Lichenibacterium minor]|uniref:Uncharacterized protein n=1 Tax=Lichenibacterium minor TaxID=2316528 RepID=A0A4Q2TXS8_9HYPH|nr:hypothetical protein [Lichenibacterium minor]RYC28912.1 hypothetical protein D3273_26760 [Lichenibacterium minor]